MITFDLNNIAFVNWKGKKSFWAKLLMETTFKTHNITSIKENKLINGLISNMDQSFPPYKYYALMLCLYYALFHLNISCLIKTKKLSVYFPLLMTCVFIFTLAGYIHHRYFLNASPGSSSFQYLRKSGQGTFAHSYRTYGFYTANKRVQSFSLTENPVVAYPYFPSHENPENICRWKITQKDNSTTYQINQERWTGAFLKLNTVIKCPLQGKAYFDHDKIMVRIDNFSGKHLKDSFIIYKNKFFAIGDIKPDISLEIYLDEEKGIQAGSMFYNRNYIKDQILGQGTHGFQGKIQEEFTGGIMSALLEFNQPGDNNLILAGWMKSSSNLPVFDNTSKNHNTTSFLEMKIDIGERSRSNHEI